MRWWVLGGSLVVLLSGCMHYTRLTTDDFARGHASRTQFGRDNYDCQVDAAVQQSRIGGGDSTGVYNRTYSSCMARHGYRTTDLDLLGFGG